MTTPGGEPQGRRAGSGANPQGAESAISARDIRDLASALDHIAIQTTLHIHRLILLLLHLHARYAFTTMVA